MDLDAGDILEYKIDYGDGSKSLKVAKFKKIPSAQLVKAMVISWRLYMLGIAQTTGRSATRMITRVDEPTNIPPAQSLPGSAFLQTNQGSVAFHGQS